MIFGEVQSQKHYSKFYPDLVRFISRYFNNVEAGIQGDAWIHVSKDDQSVDIDTFTSMNFEVKAQLASRSLAFEIIEILAKEFDVTVHINPISEFNEE